MTLVIVKPFGDYVQGSVIDNMPDDVAQSLIDGGYAVEAPEDEDTPDEVAADQGKALDKFQQLKAAHREAEEAAEKIANTISERLVKASEKVINSAAKVKVPTLPAQAKDELGGFKSYGDWLRCLGLVALDDDNAKRKMARFKAQTETNTAGGYTVPTIWAEGLQQKIRSQLFLPDYCKQFTASGNAINVPIINDTSRADASRPLRYYAVSEGSPYTESSIVFGQVVLTIYKYGVLAGASEELLMDSNSNIEEVVNTQLADEIRFCYNNFVINGAGSTEPTGILNYTSLVTITKESGQSSKTVNFANLAKMWARLYFASRSNAVWLVNQAVSGQLSTLAFPGASGTTPAYGLSYNYADEAHPMRLFGRPVLECEQCAALGAPGDIILADMTQLGMFQKPLTLAVSPHIDFKNGKISYRGFVRFDCNSLWKNVLTPYKGADTLAPYVVRESVGTT